MVIIIVALVVYFVVRGVTENALISQNRASTPSISTQSSDSYITVNSRNDKNLAAACLYGVLYEIGISYDASDESAILNSCNGSVRNASMVDFRKYELGDYSVIRYIMSCPVNGVDEHVGELIICPDK